MAEQWHTNILLKVLSPFHMASLASLHPRFDRLTLLLQFRSHVLRALRCLSPIFVGKPRFWGDRWDRAP